MPGRVCDGYLQEAERPIQGPCRDWPDVQEVELDSSWASSPCLSCPSRVVEAAHAGLRNGNLTGRRGTWAMKLQASSRMLRLHTRVQISARPLAGSVSMGQVLPLYFFIWKMGTITAMPHKATRGGREIKARETLSPVARKREHFLMRALISHRC